MNDARVIEEAQERKTAAQKEAQEPGCGKLFFEKEHGHPGNEEPLGHDLGGQAQGFQNVLKAKGHGQSSGAHNECRPSARSDEPSPGTAGKDLLIDVPGQAQGAGIDGSIQG